MTEEGMKWMQQARCPECNVPLDWATPHKEGCKEAWRIARLMQNVAPAERCRYCGKPFTYCDCSSGKAEKCD